MGYSSLSELQSDSSDASVTIDTQLCFALHSASNTIEHLYRPKLDNFGLTYPQYIVLMALAEEDDVSITSLANRLNVSKATMTPLLRRLEAKTLISRTLNKNNERQKSVRITSAGRALFAQACETTHQVLEETGLTKAQAAQIIGLTRLIGRS